LEAFGSDDRQRDVMPHSRRRFGSKQIAPGSREEFHDGPILKRRRIRHVDYGVSAFDGSRETLAGDGIDAGIWRGCDDIVALRTQEFDDASSNEAGASDDDMFHDIAFRDDYALRNRSRSSLTRSL